MLGGRVVEDKERDLGKGDYWCGGSTGGLPVGQSRRLNLGWLLPYAGAAHNAQ